MRSPLMLCAACILPVASPSNSDVSWSLYEDPLFSNPEVSLDQPDQPSSPMDHMTAFNQLPDESIFADQDDISSASNKNDEWFETSPWTDIALDNSLELSDCSSSEILPAVGRLRVKRLNEGGICKDRPPASSSGSVSDIRTEDPDLSGLKEVLPQDPDDVTRLLGAMGDENQNSFCALYTNFVLPYGVCSRGEVMVSGILTLPPQGVFYQYTLKQFTIGMLVESSKIHTASRSRPPGVLIDLLFSSNGLGDFLCR